MNANQQPTVESLVKIDGTPAIGATALSHEVERPEGYDQNLITSAGIPHQIGGIPHEGPHTYASEQANAQPFPGQLTFGPNKQ